MPGRSKVAVVLAILAGLFTVPSGAAEAVRSSAEIIAAAPAQDWREVAAENLLLMDLPQGRVLIELAPRFAPRHVENIRTLAKNRYYDGLAIVRVQDNFVAQWGDPDADDPARARPLAPARSQLPAEFSRALGDLPLVRLPDVDGWAPVTGFVDGFAVAAEPAKDMAWLAHCYGVVGAGRADAVDSSTGAELYAVIGQGPRALDLNITVVGRVLDGIERLSALPRGGPNMGFYDDAQARVPLLRVRLASELPSGERPAVQVMRSESGSWQALLAARRERGGWYVRSPQHIEICSASVPVKVRGGNPGEATTTGR